MSSERCGAHRCVHGKRELLLGYGFGQTLQEPGYMCINMYTYRLEPSGQRHRHGFCSNAPSHAYSLLTFLPYQLPSVPNLSGHYSSTAGAETRSSAQCSSAQCSGTHCSGVGQILHVILVLFVGRVPARFACAVSRLRNV